RRTSHAWLAPRSLRRKGAGPRARRDRAEVRQAQDRGIRDGVTARLRARSLDSPRRRGMAMTERRRADSRSRVIHASPDAIYAAFLSPDAWLEWLPPAGMTGRMHSFDPRPGGSYRMELFYGENFAGAGKTSETSDV